MPGNATDPGSPFGVFSLLFALTALPFGIISGIMYGNLQLGLELGFFFGLLFGLCMIPFLRVDRRVIRYTDRGRFVPRLKVEMSELRYAPTVSDSDYLQFRAPNTIVQSLNRITVHFDDDAGTATFIGPRWYVKKILTRLGRIPKIVDALAPPAIAITPPTIAIAPPAAKIPSPPSDESAQRDEGTEDEHSDPSLWWAGIAPKPEAPVQQAASEPAATPPPVEPPAGLPQPAASLLPTVQTKSERRRHTVKIAVGSAVIALIALITAVVVWAPHKPASASGPAPAAAAMTTWFRGGGAYHWNNIRSALSQVSQLTRNPDLGLAHTACSNLQIVVDHAVNYIPMPDWQAQQDWAGALYYLKTSAYKCVEAADTNNGPLMTQASNDMSAAGAQLKAVNDRVNEVDPGLLH
ncbi:MAG: hypothetical protein J2P27_01150 [Actinobacteria bacterium]|nr:hypothetical protein [Actinomycetota bacterium]